MLSSSLWLWASLLIFVGFSARPFLRKIFVTLDDRAQDIETKLKEAQSLYQVAVSLLLQEEERAKLLDLESGEMLYNAQLEAKHLNRTASEEFETLLAFKKHLFAKQLAHLERKIIQESEEKIICFLMQTIELFLQENLSQEQHKQIIDHKIEKILQL
jgi:F0F1-type ATP synthase membrane subunit b/b'